MPAVLKLRCEGEVRRAKLDEEQELSHDVVRDVIRSVWPELGECVAKYADEDGDQCVLCSATFADFRAHGEEKQGHSLFRLDLSAAGGSPSAAALAEPRRAEPVVVEEPQAPMEEAASEALAAREGTSEEAAAAVDSEAARCFPGRGFWKGKGKGFWKGKGKGFWKGKGQTGDEIGDSEAWLLKPKRLVGVLARLQCTEGVSSKSAASFLVHLLPQLVARLAEEAEDVEAMLRMEFLPARKLVADLAALAMTVPALDAAAAVLVQALSDTPASLAEPLLGLLFAINELPFEDQISVVEQLCKSGSMQSTLQGAQLLMPWRANAPLEHRSVTCDGCGASPLPGVRFRCTTIEDYDLCGECYAKKGLLVSGDNEFRCTAEAGDQVWQRWPAACSGSSDEASCARRKMAGAATGDCHGHGWHHHWQQKHHHHGHHHCKGEGSCCRGKGDGKGDAEGEGTWKGKGGCKRKWARGFEGDEAWLLQPRKLLWVLAGLRDDGIADAQVGSLLAHLLPQATMRLAEQAAMAEGALRVGDSPWRALIGDLCAVALASPLLEGSAAVLSAALQDDGANLVEALVPLLLALTELPLHAQTEVLREVLGRPSARGLLDSASAWTAHWGMPPPLVHGSITCDGCGASPLRGVRFKSLSRPDYDLCGECYGTMRDTLPDKFGCKVADWGHMWKRKHEAMLHAMPQGLSEGIQNGWHAFIAAMKGCKGKGKSQAQSSESESQQQSPERSQWQAQSQWQSQ